ncbi:MAG TPA: PepSY-associated TM helix domain-containing protein [Croceibacterium sp.]|nr:PepSY-associated TM helix domain-containing protein [Croceibacterium sp.]
MGWLHNWSGIILGWLLFVIFVTGSCGYYRHEITLMMTPELRPLAQVDVPPETAADRAVQWLVTHAGGAGEWTTLLPDEKSPALRVSWFGDEPGDAVLDPRTGNPLSPEPRATGGGDFLYRLHSDLHFVSPMAGRIVVSLIGVALLMLLVTGLVTHRNIIRDLFRFRRGRGWRTRLDLHNMTGVLGLPYHLLIVVSGLVTVMMLLMPWGVASVYGASGLGQFAQEAFPSAVEEPSGTVSPLRVAPLVKAAQRRWHGDEVGEIHIDNPGTAGMTVTINHPIRGILPMRKPSVTFDPSDGRVLGTTNEDLSNVSLLHSQLFGLHVAHFAGPVVRLLMFCFGLVGAAMVATGLLLWTAKRWPSPTAEAGKIKPRRAVIIVDRLNAAVLAGLPIAIGGYFWANRLIPAGAANRAIAEQQAMFWVWAAAIVLAFISPARMMWPLLLAIAGSGLAAAGFASLLAGGTGSPVEPVLLVTGLALLAVGFSGRFGKMPGAAGAEVTAN